MNKTIILFLLTFCSLQGFSQKAGTVKLSGVLKNFNNQVNINDHSEFKNLSLPGNERMIIPDSLGKFAITFNLKKPQYFKLGRNVMYLSPGDAMEIMVDYNDPKKATFTGTGAAPNAYLRGTPFPKGGSFIDAGSKIKGDLSTTIKEVKAIADSRLKDLDAIKGLSPNFKLLEIARVKADIIKSFTDLDFYYPYMRKIKNPDSLAMFNAEFDKIVKPEMAKYEAGFINANYLQLETYRDICNTLIAVPNAKSAKDYAKIKSWLEATVMVDQLARINEKQKLAAYASQTSKIAVPEYKTAVQKVYDQLIKFGNGDEAIDFTAHDVSGKQVAIKDLKGKFLYIDLWATWCGPCQDELKYLEVLKEKFKDNKDIVFVSLSIDDDKVAWEKSLQTRKAGGVQLIINRTQLNDYAVSTIPRTILIDKNFKILEMNGMQPSNKKTEEFLKSQLNK